MEQIRKTLTRDTVLRRVTLHAGVSESGLGCGLVRNSRSVAFASRALPGARQIYIQFRKDVLAIWPACTKFHLHVVH